MRWWVHKRLRQWWPLQSPWAVKPKNDFSFHWALFSSEYRLGFLSLAFQLFCNVYGKDFFNLWPLFWLALHVCIKVSYEGRTTSLEWECLALELLMRCHNPHQFQTEICIELFADKIKIIFWIPMTYTAIQIIWFQNGSELSSGRDVEAFVKRIIGMTISTWCFF